MGFRGFGFRGLGFRGLGFRGLGYLGWDGLGFRVWEFLGFRAAIPKLGLVRGAGIVCHDPGDRYGEDPGVDGLSFQSEIAGRSHE